MRTNSIGKIRKDLDNITTKHAKLERFIEPNEFNTYKTMAYAKGFLMVSSSPLTRSSYHASEDFYKLKKIRERKVSNN